MTSTPTRRNSLSRCILGLLSVVRFPPIGGQRQKGTKCLPDNGGAPAFEIPLAEFLESYTPPFSALAMSEFLDELYADPYERVIIDELVSQYRRDGRFRYPIRITEDREICNGCHRAAASKLMHTPMVRLTTEEPPPVGDQDQWHIMLQVDAVTDEIMDILMGVLRSFPMNDTWVETDMLSAAGDIISGYWNGGPELLPQLVETLIGRLAAVDIPASFVGCFGWDQDEEDWTVDASHFVITGRQ